MHAPKQCKLKLIEDFINKKAKWIIAKRQEILTKPSIFTKDSVSILNKTYKLIISNKTELIENEIYLNKDNLETSFTAILLNMAKKYLPKRVKDISLSLGLDYGNVKVGKAKTRWGSCSVKNNLNFSCFLLMCDEEVVDYVIIHELCHTKIKNHSSLYWNLVKKYYYNYNELDKKLNAYSKLLKF